jgi:RND family efflux transporter MFP subunit
VTSFLEKLRTPPKKWVLLGGAILIIIFWWLFSTENGLKKAERFTVIERDLVQEVTVTGQVKASQTAKLGFEKTGKIAEILITEGQKVETGQELVKLENGDLYAQLLEAEASVQSAQAQYQALKAELSNARSEVTSAQAGVDTERAQLEQFVSALEESQQQLNELRKGTRQEELDIAEVSVKNTENEILDLETAMENTENAADQDLSALLEEAKDLIAEASTSAQSLLSENLLEIIYPIRFPSNKTCEAQVSAFSQISRETCFAALDAVEGLVERSELLEELETLEITLIMDELSYAKSSLALVRSLFSQALALADAALAFDEDNSSAFTDAQLTTLKSPITTGRSTLESIFQRVTSTSEGLASQIIKNQSNIDAAQKNLNRAEDKLASAELDLELKRAGSTPEQIAAQEAKVKQAVASLSIQEAKIKQAETAPSAQQAKIGLAQANLNAQGAKIKQAQAKVNNIEAQIGKTILTAPFAGVITQQEGELGEIVASNSLVVSLISDDEYEIEANIPEIDIAKLSKEDLAQVNLDAYGPEEIFNVHVRFIDPAETIIENVTNYQVTFQFDEQDERVRSGMTANISVLTDEWEDVLAVPEYALDRRSDAAYVQRLMINNEKEDSESVLVEIGELSSDGFRLIRSGLTAGDIILILQE